MKKFCELEFRIEWKDLGRYYVSARFMDLESDLENQLLDPVEIKIDLDKLRQYRLDAENYGKLLTEMFFGPSTSPVCIAFTNARFAAANSRDGLRIRLTIQGSAPELHDVAWETLRDPSDSSRLLTQETVWFSRFLSAKDFFLRPVPENGELQALIVIANPSDLEAKWQLAPIEAKGELNLAVAALSQEYSGGGRRILYRNLGKAATIYNIVTELRENYSDILYLVCHGALSQEGEPRLLLEKEDGTGQPVKGRELVERLSDMGQRPRLVVLASCQSAGNEQGGTLTAIGPKLATAGVPSVIAMQGRISMESTKLFMARLFKELAKYGQIDRAMTVARSDIRDQPDWWMPVLFMRLKTGQILPRTAWDTNHFDKWDATVADIENNKCVPVLGSGLVETIIGTTRDLAQRWAERYEYPLAPSNRDDLSQVAQYLVCRQSKSVAQNALRDHLIFQLRTKFRGELQKIKEEGRDLLSCPLYRPGLLSELFSCAGKILRDRDENDIHRLIAKIPAKVFINANFDNLLKDALEATEVNGVKKKPRVRLCNWVIHGDMPEEFGPTLPEDYVPTVQEPLIFHVFGNLDYPDSLVLTEDDFFDFLIAVTRNETLQAVRIPGAVTSELTLCGLLLLGFQADDWDFRVLLRSILKQPGQIMARQRTRVAVQLNPTEGRIIDPERAVRYLRDYFQEESRINTFWGSAEEFMQRLAKKCEQRGIEGFD